MFRGGAFRRRWVALIAYYTVVIVILGPTWLARAGAARPAPVPARISLNVAMLTRPTKISTFTTPFPITVAVASDGTFTIPRDRLAFALVDVAVDKPRPAFGRFTVRAEALSDFAGTVDATSGEVTLAGYLQLLWSKQKPAHAKTGRYMRDCPVGPFAVHLSTATVGGTPLARLSHEDPTRRTARLVDDDLDVRAVHEGTKQCAGDERRLNGALSLPILPKPKVTTTTTTTVPMSSSSSTSTSTSTTSTSTSTSTSTTTESTTTTTTSTTTSTTIAPAVGSETTSTTTAAPPPTSGATTDALAGALDPNVLAFEPSPSIVSTLTMAAVPPPVSSTTATTRPFSPTPRSTPTSVPRSGARHKPLARPAAKAARPTRRVNKHAQTTRSAAVSPTTTTTVARTKITAPPLYFSPFNFPRRISPPKALSPGPLFNLGKNAIAHNRDGLSLLFVALLVSPLVAFGLGLVASDLGWRAPWRRKRDARANSRAR